MKIQTIVVCIGCLGIWGCTVSDGDRCPDGYQWSENYQSCLDAEEDAEKEDDTGSESEDTGEDTGEDTDTTPLPEGMGQVCSDETDCAGLAADHCVLSPLAPSDPGYCSTTGCEPTDADSCPGSYECCDCTALGADVISCLTSGDAEQAAGYGCDCE